MHLDQNCAQRVLEIAIAAWIGMDPCAVESLQRRQQPNSYQQTSTNQNPLFCGFLISRICRDPTKERVLVGKETGTSGTCDLLANGRERAHRVGDSGFGPKGFLALQG